MVGFAGQHPDHFAFVQTSFERPYIFGSVYLVNGRCRVESRRLIRSVFVVSLGFSLAQCTLPAYTSEIVAANFHQIAIKVGRFADPRPAAAAHCARYGTTAVLQSGIQDVYVFVCAPSNQ